MELTEAVQRILHRWRVILLLLLAGLAIPIALYRNGQDRYTATARIIVGEQITSVTQAEVLVDSALGVVTSPTQIEEALELANVERSVARFSREQIDVESVGTSPVLLFSVIDSNPEAAAILANALAQGFVDGYHEPMLGPLESQLAELDTELSELDELIVETDAANNARTVPSTTLRLRLQDAIERRDQVRAQRDAVNDRLLSVPRAVFMDSAATPTAAEPRRLSANLVVGGLLGAILGVVSAAILETLRPTIVGPGALARFLAAPVVGTVKGRSNGACRSDLAVRLRMAAESANVSDVHVVSLDESTDIRYVIDEIRTASNIINVELIGNYDLLGDPSDMSDLSVSLPSVGSLVRTEVPEEMTPTTRRGIVVVAPPIVSRSALDEIAHLLQITQWPLLGIICFRNQRNRWTFPALRPSARRKKAQAEPTEPLDEADTEPESAEPEPEPLDEANPEPESAEPEPEPLDEANPEPESAEPEPEPLDEAASGAA